MPGFEVLRSHIFNVGDNYLLSNSKGRINFPKHHKENMVPEKSEIASHDTHLSQCMAKGGLWHDVILVRKEHYGVTAVYFSICTKSKSFEKWKIYVIEK